MTYKVRARFNEVWFLSEENFDEEGVAKGVALGMEVTGAAETEVVDA